MAEGTDELREKVYRANMELAGSGLVTGTFGNVSGVSREHGTHADQAQRGSLRPSSPPPTWSRCLSRPARWWAATCVPRPTRPTHLELYRAFSCGGVVHTHSEHATTLAQAGLPLRCMGTTHADHFRGDVPVTRPLTEEEVEGDYEGNTGFVIVETFREAGISPEEIAAVLVANHGPFTWGRDPHQAVENARVLEFLARMEVRLRVLAPDARRPEAFQIDKHFLRKHGQNATYGQM